MTLLAKPRLSGIVTTLPLVGVMIGIALAAGPLFSRVAPWVFAVLFLAMFARLRTQIRGGRLPSLPQKIALFGLGIGGIAFGYGTAVGIEPGMSIMLLLVALKIIETNTSRDFQVLALLGYFLALCDLFFSQDFTLWLYVTGVFALLTAALVLFHRGGDARGTRGALATSATLLLQSVPVILALLLFVPRTQHQFLTPFTDASLGSTGMSDPLSPGSIASLALGNELVFSAGFPDGKMPPLSSMYWRAGVLYKGDGFAWERAPGLPAEGRSTQLGGPGIRQRIILQPHGARWILALDRPASTDLRGARMAPGGFLESSRPIFKTTQYEVISRPENRETNLGPIQRVEALHQPRLISPNVRALVTAWRKAHADDRELVDAALHYFHDERFTYTLEPGTYTGDALDDFLFVRRAGFCEHYAAAFASLMRIAGIPSRVVVGYHGGELNQIGNYVRVRQSDAHAWCEVWIRNSGWLRVDPTEFIAPDRLSSGLAGFLENRAAANASAAQTSATITGWREIGNELRMAWDNVNYQWDLRVLGFDEENQRAFFVTLGLGHLQWLEIPAPVAVFIALVLIAIGLWQRRPGRKSVDETHAWYERFCRSLAAAGITRAPAEGPLHFAERAAATLPDHAHAIREVTALYIALRYAPSPAPLPAFIRAVRALPTLPRKRQHASP